MNKAYIKTVLKNKAQKCLRKVGYEINKTHVVPFIRTFHLGNISFSMWIMNRDSRDWYTQEFLDKDAEIAILQELASQGGNILEVGSHHGVTGTIMAIAAGDKGRVIGVEAHPETAMVAMAQTTLNNLGLRFPIIHKAVAERSGEIVEMEICHCSAIKDDGLGGGLRVETITVDDIAKEYGSIALLKIDVEGFEYEVLKGAADVLRTLPAIDLELHLTYLKKRNINYHKVLELIPMEHYDVSVIQRTDTTVVLPYSEGVMSGQDNVNLIYKRKEPQGIPSQ